MGLQGLRVSASYSPGGRPAFCGNGSRRGHTASLSLQRWPRHPRRELNVEAWGCVCRRVRVCARGCVCLGLWVESPACAHLPVCRPCLLACACVSVHSSEKMHLRGPGLQILLGHGTLTARSSRVAPHSTETLFKALKVQISAPPTSE